MPLAKTLVSYKMNETKISDEKRTVLKIGGMTCAACVSAIQKHVSNIPGVQNCDVNLGAEKAVLQYDSSKVNLEMLERAVKEAGFRVIYEKLTLKVGGITDASDAEKLEKKLEKKEGIRYASVNFGNGQILIEYNPALLSLTDIRKLVTDSGFKILSEDLSVSAEEIESKKMKRLLIISVIFTIPVVFLIHLSISHLALPFMSMPHISLPFIGTTEAAYTAFVFASIVQLGVGWRFYVGTYKMAKMKSANMDTLIAMGTSAAFVFSVTNTFPTPVWENIHYEASTMIITFILLGKYLENKTKGKASSIIRKMLELQPKTAVVLRGDEETEVPIDLLQSGDMLVVKPGEKIPVDCVVVRGFSAVDESMVTGESIPVTKKIGDTVIGGTINKEGVLVLKTLKVGSDTFLVQVVNLVEDAMGRKPPMQKLVDKIAGYFSFIVIGIAITTFLTWYFLGAPGIVLSAILPTIAILVVACPCALGLATPTAVMVGMGKAAKNGIIFKSGEGLESLGKIQTIVFDKTGTLTEGKPNVSDIVPIGPDESTKMSHLEILEMAGMAEKNSEHPLSKAIVRRAEEEGLKIRVPDKFSAIPGNGVRATFGDKTILIGNVSLMEKEQINLDNAKKVITKLQEEGKTVSIITVNDQVVGVVSFLDVPKKDSMETVSLLQKMGLEVIMLTGDNEKTAKTIGNRLGVKKIISNVVPSEKVEAIKKLQEGGKKVAMVGDGINDAPALTQADVGVAIGGGTDVALEAGSVILIREFLTDVVTAIEISKKTISKIKQNLFYAFVYNAVLIPVAAVGLLYPSLAGMAMAASSVSVVSSSLLLKRWTPPSKRKI